MLKTSFLLPNFFPQTHHFMLSKTLRNLQLLVQIPPKPLF